MFPCLLPERGSLVLTTGSSSTVSSSVSRDALSDIDSLFSLPRLTILRKEGRLEASASLSAFRSPQGRLSLRSSLRRPAKLQRRTCKTHWKELEEESHSILLLLYEQDSKTLMSRVVCVLQYNPASTCRMTHMYTCAELCSCLSYK